MIVLFSIIGLVLFYFTIIVPNQVEKYFKYKIEYYNNDYNNILSFIYKAQSRYQLKRASVAAKQFYKRNKRLKFAKDDFRNLLQLIDEKAASLQRFRK